MGRCNAGAAIASDTPSVRAPVHLGAWRAGTYSRQVAASLQSSSLNAAAAGVTTLRTDMVAGSGKRQWRLLQSGRTRSAAEMVVPPLACQRPCPPQLISLLKRKTGPRLETLGPRRPRRHGQSTTNPIPTTSVTETERQAAPAGGQSKPACPEVSVVDFQPPRSK
jgi:hypothetical protein